MREIKVGAIYKHFKGHFYKVIGIGYDTEKYDENNPESAKMVFYLGLETGMYWIRPYEMFNSLVGKEKYPEILQEYRFEEVELVKEEGLYDRYQINKRK